MKFARVGELEVAYQNNRFIKQVMEEKEYDFLSYYPVVIDIGANIGTFSLHIWC